MPMPIRRQRLLTVCAVIIVFLLYRVVQNSWDEASLYADLRSGHTKPVGAGQPPPPADYDGGIDSVAGKSNSDKDGNAPTKTTEEPPVRYWKNPPPEEPPLEELAKKPKKHWEKLPENFPVPEESIISLPSGKPKDIPKVQAAFKEESEESRTSRLQRQKRVKDEIQRSWSAYREYAWLHDELRPVSLGRRDPFCGWAATMVDSLDTLWIAGMEKEFDEAVASVAKVDFTWSPRAEIPVFETTIRYLGGLLGAFDVSGGLEGEYKILLDKAVELAEILMGVFDTPNRMPLLYYNWKPEYVSKAHRAGKVGIAELATLSMEFTRLAQITKGNKYYDAIDRITNGLVEMQEAGLSMIPGLFPEGLNVSGCNRTAAAAQQNSNKEAQKQLDSKELLKDTEGDIEKGQIPTKEDDRVQKRNVEFEETEKKMWPDSVTKSREKLEEEEECVPQGIVPSGYGHQMFHMGGAQDSAYEYFPKEYLLLGGLEPKYQKLYEDTVDAVNNWLLYRPMAKDDWDVLFPARVAMNSRDELSIHPVFEVTHLTCFIGGMYGLGGRIFGREDDVEVAKQLTDGCVWAYQLMPTGLMPETSTVMPCPSLEKCEFNETLWWDELDGSRQYRERKLAKWEKENADLIKNAAASEPEVVADAAPQELRALEEDKVIGQPKVDDDQGNQGDNGALDAGDASDHLAAGFLRKRAAIPAEDAKADEAGSELPESLKHKLGLNGGAADEIKATPTQDEPPTDPDHEAVHAAMEDTADTSNSIPQFSVPAHKVIPNKHPEEKPLSHEEYVQKKIKEDGLPPGFEIINSGNYLLRPEAIESVWYMYRITGDPTWQDKGWTMFEATVKASRTKVANSAIKDVTSEVPELKDEMESFWIAETLKYYYLLFSEPDVVSLDEWVLNTEAHPFKRPT